jgi:dipeptidyl aminopeptidase/acylaminoacyl peptidase
MADGRRSLAILAALVLACVLVSVGYVAVAAARSRAGAARAANQPARLAAILARPHVYFLDTPDGLDDRAAVAPLDDLTNRYVTGVVCRRLYVASGRGFCLGSGGYIDAPRGASILDGRLDRLRSLDVVGLPSRVRASPNGERFAYTVFIAGDSYGGPFSTRTFIVAADGGAPLQLEDLNVVKDGAPLHPADENFWGVTFASDGDRFYATMGTGGHSYLISGSVSSRRAEVVRDGVECPSLSPDGRRIAFKRPLGNGRWQLSVLDLATGAERGLAETRSVDDQPEWLDDSHVLYAVTQFSQPASLAIDTWVVGVDDQAPPRLFLRGASSPSVAR